MSASGSIVIQYPQKYRNSLSNCLKNFEYDNFLKARNLGGFLKIATIVARVDTIDVSNVNYVRIIPTNKYGLNISFSKEENLLEG